MTNKNFNLTLNQIQALLQATPQTLHNELNFLPKDLLIWRPEPREWCINEIIGHLIECDLNGFAGRIQLMLEQEQPTMLSWNAAAKVAERQDCEQDASTLIETLRTMRQENTQFISQLTPQQFNRIGLHPHSNQLKLRVSDLIFEWIHHDHNHIKQISSNIQAHVWPKLDNIHRFFQTDLNPVS